MRVTVCLLGFELDLTLGPATTDDSDDGSALNGGTLASTPISFVTSWPVPEEIPIQPHTPAWDEPEERGR